MSRNALLVPPLLILLLLGSAFGGEALAGDRIVWAKDLPTALKQAKESQRILMVCVNAKFVEGREEEEPAAKGLREVVYLDPRVVKRSRAFVCVLLTPESSTTDYGELRLLGIEGQIVSPQHIFIAPEGDRILLRRQYWRYGQGEPAVKVLLSMMDEAEQSAGSPADPQEPTPEGAGGPKEGEDRFEWLSRMLVQVSGAPKERAGALKALVEGDEDGDCIGPLLALLSENKKDADLAKAIIRALGRNGLEAAAEPIAEFLKHRDESVRANAAVSLEYIGSREKKVVTALLSAVGRQKDEVIANHMYRALGRCGVKEGRVLNLLLKMAASGKSEFSTYGPVIGLTYFEGDEKAMRGVEKLLKLLGVPGSRRGGGQNTVKRGLLSWTLACIGDEKSAKFVREELLSKLENVKAFWVPGMQRFWGAVADKCDGDDSQLDGIVAGVRLIARFARGGNLGRYGAETRGLMDEARKGRDDADFTPKGDNILESGEGD